MGVASDVIGWESKAENHAPKETEKAVSSSSVNIFFLFLVFWFLEDNPAHKKLLAYKGVAH